MQLSWPLCLVARDLPLEGLFRDALERRARAFGASLTRLPPAGARRNAEIAAEWKVSATFGRTPEKGIFGMARRFFIVDDDETIIEFMTLMLETAGHEVSSCLAGTEALPRIAARRPDCILTDLMMAELDGLQLCEEIRSKPTTANAAVIVVSARKDPYWRNRARESGADGYIVKPLSVDNFIEKIETIIRDTGRA